MNNKNKIIYNNLYNITGILSYTVLILTLITLIILCLRVIQIKQPIEIGEGSFVITTELLLRGENPYSLKLMPTFVNLYGIVPNFINYPFAFVFGSSLAIHRLINITAIFSISFIIFLFTRRTTHNLLLSLFASILLGSQLILNLQNITAKPDALGMLFFVSSIYITEMYLYNDKSLLTSAILSIVAFYSKPYFILGLFLVPLYIIIFYDKYKGFKILFFNITILFISIVLINLKHEVYFLNTIINHIHSENRSFTHLIIQSKDYLILNFSLIIIFTYYLLISRKNNFGFNKLGNYISYIKKNTSLSQFTFVVCFFIIFLRMGWHKGTHLYYFVELLSPFFVTTVLSIYNKFLHKSIFLNLLIILNIGYFLLHSFILIRFEDSSANFFKWYNKVSMYDNVYNSGSISLFQYKDNSQIYENRYSEYYQLALNGHEKLEVVKKAEQHFNDTILDINNKVANKYFDAIVLTSNSKYHFINEKLLKENYYLTDWIKLSVLGNLRIEELWLTK